MEGQREGSDKSEFMEKLETGTRRAESPPPLRAGRRLGDDYRKYKELGQRVLRAPEGGKELGLGRIGQEKEEERKKNRSQDK